MPQDRPLHKGPYRSSRERYGRAETPATIGHAIRAARREAYMTQAELAAKMFCSGYGHKSLGGIARTYLTQMERGAKPVYWSNWKELCRLLPELAKLKVSNINRSGSAGLELTPPKKSRRSQ